MTPGVDALEPQSWDNVWVGKDGLIVTGHAHLPGDVHTHLTLLLGFPEHLLSLLAGLLR